jgi:hypothetical protein
MDYGRKGYQTQSLGGIRPQTTAELATKPKIIDFHI